ncbi:PREDICTED: uncharacterized protein LOC109223247 isoform X1 [Nicotiana attenuata]|uniref:uncharacterized protein LOC109223247 isoform X1 n=1 Tax=Nicotiana attenuata TaxID=49451 RepID=UPI0009051D87|nr:PREDICTED: uncharacterized protein LOC109223247 isoform X1 [Nicotiana attenuata]
MSFKLAKNALSHTNIQSCFPKQDLKGQTVAIVGLGKSGTAATKLALARGASVLAIDQNENLRPIFKQNVCLDEHNDDLKTVFGNFDNEILKEADIVVVSPGVPLEKYGLFSMLCSGKQVLSELDFAAQVIPSCTKILAVTGTNGKSTVATFAGQMLNCLGFETFVGGNLGVPLSEAVFQCLTWSHQRPLQVAVVEVSSYQLEIPPKYFCPSVAVILNLTPDHLERHQTMRNYAATKCRIFSHMRDQKIGILPVGNQYLDEAIMDHANGVNLAWIGARSGVRVNVEAKIADINLPTIGCVSQLKLGELKAVGKHNYSNAAVAALSVIGLDIEINATALSSTISKLGTLPHRMQVVHVDNDEITWVDDSKATNVEATYSGLLGFEQKSVLLLGGLAKEVKTKASNGFEQLVEPLQHHRAVITFGFSGTMIQKTLCANGLTIPCLNAKTLKNAVSLARSIAQHGDAIVLSPGCASFDEFRNFEHRGRTFQELAISLE